MIEIYKEKILEHYRKPRNFGIMENADLYAKDVNPGCGDEFEVYIKLDDKDNNKIKEIKFNGKGCVISTASASILSEFVKNKTIEEVEKLDREDVLKLLGIDLNPARIKCALLPLIVIKASLKTHPKFCRGWDLNPRRD